MRPNSVSQVEAYFRYFGMDITGEGVSVYAEAKGEYTKQLCQYMLPALQQYFLDMLEDAKVKEPNANKVLLQFQKLLEDVPEWNIDKVQRETSALGKATNCDYLEELLTAVFIAHTKVLSAIRLTTRQKKLQITIPRLDHFLHRTFTECSRLIWSNTYLFSPSAPSIERQKNLRLIETILHDGIQQAIRGMLPVKNILREYLRDDADEEEAEAEEAEAEKEEKAEAEKEEKAEAEAEAEVEVETKKPEAKAEPEPEPEAKPEKAEKAEAKPEKSEAKSEAKSEEKPERVATPVFTGLDSAIEEVPIKEFETEKLFEEEITVMDGAPEAMDGFEDLTGGDILSMEFEELT